MTDRLRVDKLRVEKLPSKDWVVLVLAISMGIALNVFTCAVLWEAIVEHAALSENATQVLIGWGTGTLGIIGAYIGYRVGIAEHKRDVTEEDAGAAAGEDVTPPRREH